MIEILKKMLVLLRFRAQDEKALLFVRASAQADGEAAHSLAEQERACIEFAQKAGYTVDPEFNFRERESASNPDGPELDRLLQSARDGQVNAVLVHHYDRLSRDPLQLTRVLSELRRSGVRLVATGRRQTNNQGGLRDGGQSRWRFWRWRKKRGDAGD